MIESQTVATGGQCLERAQHGLAWLLAQQTRDGDWQALERPAIDAFYKGSWALAAAGRLAAAHSLLDHVQHHFLQPDGDFQPRVRLIHQQIHHQYANAYVIIGAQKLERYEIVRPALAFLLAQQDPQHGGFYSIKTPAGQRNRADSMSTAMAGVACLATGRLAEAERAAAFLAQLIEAQPDPARFYSALNPDGSVRTEYPDDQAFWGCVETGKPGQCWYAVGLPFVFLVLLAQATGAQQYLDLVRWLWVYLGRCLQPWDGSSSGKAGWGASILYRITGEAQYRDVALHVANTIASYQVADGYFPVTKQPVAGPKIEPSVYDVTAEFVLWLTLIESNLGLE